MCLHHKKTLKKTRIKLYNTQALPVLLYRSKTWTINLLKPSGYGMHQQVKYFNNFTLCPHCIYVFLFVWEQMMTCTIYIKKNWLVFITEMKIVYSAVRTGPVNEAVCTQVF
jgi:hypothetical protein